MPLYLIRLRPPRANFVESQTAAEADSIGRHFIYLKDLTEKGIVKLAGRTENASLGLVILETDSEETARQVMCGDPAVSAGVFSAELHPFLLALGGLK